MATVPAGVIGFREEGNRLYKRAHADDNSVHIRKVLLTKAISYYARAVRCAVNDEDERASLDKNLGLAHFAISSLDALPAMEIAENKREALKHIGAAWSRAKSGVTKKDEAWTSKIEELFEKVLTSGVNKVIDLARAAEEARKKKERRPSADGDGPKRTKKSGAAANKKQKTEEEPSETETPLPNITARDWVRFFYVMIEHVEPRTHLVTPFLTFARQLFQYAVRARENADYKDAQYYLDEMAYPMGEAERLSKERTATEKALHGNNNVADQEAEDVAVESEVRVMREEVIMEKSIAEAMSAIQQGGELLTIAIINDETPNMNLIFDAMDWFKSAALKARGFDLEQEAIACHHIGRIYEKVIKLKGRAKEYYMQVLSLNPFRNATRWLIVG